MISIPFFLTLYAGFTHAFETDHILAVSNIVSNRKNIKLSLKDGAFWGFGHTSTIVFVGIIMLLLKVKISDQTFQYFESTVGLMLIILGVFRLSKIIKEKKNTVHNHTHQHQESSQCQHLHVHISEKEKHVHTHKLAYGVGLIHGLAGSGALILIVMAQSKTTFNGLIYLLLFGLGSVLGMMFAAGLFSIPFSKRILVNKYLQIALILISGTLCISYGSWVIYKNLIA
ncbi:MAG: hypothetical protein RLZZ118_1721 [Bacteroidota bacterium]|jgi:cytochrome c biogenesis protein CcdA